MRGADSMTCRKDTASQHRLGCTCQCDTTPHKVLAYRPLFCNGIISTRTCRLSHGRAQSSVCNLTAARALASRTIHRRVLVTMQSSCQCSQAKSSQSLGLAAASVQWPCTEVAERSKVSTRSCIITTTGTGWRMLASPQNHI